MERKHMTLRALQSQVASTTGKKAPSKKKLLKSGEPLDSYGAGRYRYAAFKNGFALSVTGKRSTVVHIDECKGYSYKTEHPEYGGPDSATPSQIDEEIFLDKQWLLRILLEAEDNFQDNGDNRTENWLREHPEITAKVFDMGAYQSAEDIVIKKENRRRLLDMMTEKQKEVFILYYDYGYTQPEIGEILAINRFSVKSRMEGVVRKMRIVALEGQLKH